VHYQLGYHYSPLKSHLVGSVYTGENAVHNVTVAGKGIYQATIVEEKF
jgi:hypothetical protein